MDIRSLTIQVVLAIVKQLAGQLVYPIDVRLGAKIGSFAPLAGVLYIALFVAFGHVTEACLEQIPGPKFLAPFVEPAFFALGILGIGIAVTYGSLRDAGVV